MSNISVTTNQSVIEVTEVSGITVTTPEGQTIDVTVPNSSVSVTNTTDDITVLTGGTLTIQTGGITSVNGDSGPIVVLDTDDIDEGSTNLYYTDSRFDTRLAIKTTTNLAEGTNLYYTQNRFNSAFAAKTTTDLTEGTNLYYTSSRANSDFDTRLATKTTDNLAEGSTNQYFTNSRARTAISVTDSGGDGSLNYDNSTGVITYTGPSASEVRSHFTAGTGVTITSGEIAIGQPVATTDTVSFSSVTTTGDIAVNGGDITTTSTTATVFNTTATTLNIGGAATTMNIGNASGTVTIPGNLTINGTTTNINTQNLLVEDKNIIIGDVAIPSDTTADGGGITLKGATDKTITWTNSTDSWDFNQDIKTSGNIIIGGNNIKASDGSIAQTLVPITGYNPNVDFTGNIVKGAIRTGAGESTGDIFSLGGVGYTGISVDNTDKVTDRTGIVLRSFGGSLTSGTPRNVILGEAARGSAASPSNLTSGTPLIDIVGTGYNNLGWITDQVSSSPALIRLASSENWSNGLNNLGSRFQVLLQPQATTMTAGGASLQTTLNFTPENGIIRTDSFTLQNKAGSSLISVNSSGNFTIQGTVPAQGSVMNTYNDGSHNTVSINQYATSANNFPLVNFLTQRTTDQTNYTPTQSGDNLGGFKFNGNAYTSTTPGVPAGPGAQIRAAATENWTSTANGTRVNFDVIKKGTIDSVSAISAASDQIAFSSDTIYFQDSNNVALTSDKINYTRTYGEFCYTNAAGFGFAAQNTIYAMPLDTTNLSSGVTTSNTSRVNINVSGTYKLIMSLQAVMVTNSVGTFKFWLRKNNSDVANSMTEVDLLKDQKSVIAMDWMVQSNGSDYFEIVYATSSVHYADITFPTIAATTSPYIAPLAPALILNVIPIGA